MALKVLKNIARCPTCTRIGAKCVQVYDLKQEAIKWAYGRSYKIDSDWCEFFGITKENLDDALCTENAE